jgi:hypothetical protein
VFGNWRPGEFKAKTVETKDANVGKCVKNKNPNAARYATSGQLHRLWHNDLFFDALTH